MEQGTETMGAPGSRSEPAAVPARPDRPVRRPVTIIPAVLAVVGLVGGLVGFDLQGRTIGRLNAESIRLHGVIDELGARVHTL
jgi:hypothetical protein